MKFSMYKFKAMAPVMALFQKQPLLPFKQDYDNLRLHRQKSALGSDTARSGRCFHRNQSAVSTSHNVPSDTLLHSEFNDTVFILQLTDLLLIDNVLLQNGHLKTFNPFTGLIPFSKPVNFIIVKVINQPFLEKYHFYDDFLSQPIHFHLYQLLLYS